VTQPPVVVVMGAGPQDPPPGIARIADLVDIKYAPDRASLVEEIVAADALYSWWASREDLEDAWAYAHRLRWVQVSNVGVHGFLFPALVESDVIVTNGRGAAERHIGEAVLGYLVALARGFRAIFDDQRAHTWGDRDTERLAGKRLLIVGPGPIGREIGRACRLGLEMSVEAVGRSRRAGDEVFEQVSGPEGFHTALSHADYVVDAMPLTDETRRMFDAAAFAAMKQGARFVNIGRGSTVDEAALVEALQSGSLAGAAIDVFEHEPLPADSPLWDMPGVIVSPHTSGRVKGWREDFATIFYENVERWVRGEELLNVVDKHLGFPTAL
jgi:phosphoglycerate dehydrogenase-like enzyme